MAWWLLVITFTSSLLMPHSGRQALHNEIFTFLLSFLLKCSIACASHFPIASRSLHPAGVRTQASVAASSSCSCLMSSNSSSTCHYRSCIPCSFTALSNPRPCNYATCTVLLCWQRAHVPACHWCHSPVSSCAQSPPLILTLASCVAGSTGKGIHEKP